jgi:hypothetical protein
LFSPPITKKIRANRREPPPEVEASATGKKTKQNRRALEWFYDLIKTDPSESFVTWQGPKGHFVIHDTDKLLLAFQDFRKKDDYKLENIVHNFLRPYNMDEVHGEKRLKNGNVYISLDTETLPDGDEASVFRPGNRGHLASMIHRGTGIPQKRYILTQGNTTVISTTPHHLSGSGSSGGAGGQGNLMTPLHRSTRAASKVADPPEPQHHVMMMPQIPEPMKMEPMMHPMVAIPQPYLGPRSELDGLRPDFFLPQTINAIVSTNWMTLEEARKDLDRHLLEAFNAWAHARLTAHNMR